MSQTIKVDLAEYFRQRASEAIIAAYLFGSRSRGEEHAQSDVDVAVLCDRQALASARERSRMALRLTSDLIAVSHCNEVDVVVLNDVPVELAYRAIAAGERLYCADPEAERRFRLQVQLRYIDVLPFLRRTRRIKAKSLQS